MPQHTSGVIQHAQLHVQYQWTAVVMLRFYCDKVFNYDKDQIHDQYQSNLVSITVQYSIHYFPRAC